MANLVVLLHWEDNWRNVQNGRDVDLQMWLETVKPLGATELCVADVATEITWTYIHTDGEINFRRELSLAAALAAYPTYQRVFFETERSIPGSPTWTGNPQAPTVPYTNLTDYTHPTQDAIYVFGADSNGLDIGTLYQTGDEVVCLRLVQGYSLWAVVAAALSLGDRFQKANP